jgi:transmembrane sensor
LNISTGGVVDKKRHRLTELERIAEEAANWVLRQDRGLGAREQDEFSAWLAADPRHGVQLSRHRAHWNRLDRLADWRPEHSMQPNPDLLAPPLRPRLARFAPAFIALGAAAVIAFVAVASRSARLPENAQRVIAKAEPPLSDNRRILPDGSTIELNRGAVIAVRFSPTVRRVILERGEAHFVVMTEAARPFVVSARKVDVCAIGTAFNVSVDDASVEVLVTAGRVQLNSSAEASPAGVLKAAPLPPVLEASQRAVVSLAPISGPPQIDTLTRAEIKRALAWQHRLLDYTGAPLEEIVAEFNRRNDVQLVLVDPELAKIRMSATMRSDNVEGFVRLLEIGFGARAERRGDSEILLRSAR